MAIYHLNMEPVRRHKGGNAVDSAAYLAREKLRDARSEKTFNHTDQSDLYRAQLIGTRLSRSEIWAKAEQAEKRPKAVVAREIVVALPNENSHEENWGLALEFAAVLAQRLKVVVDVGMHIPESKNGQPNPHIHFLFSSRIWGETAEKFGAKTREMDVPWRGSKVLKSLRVTWENMVNQSLPAGVKKVSCKSHADLGDGLWPKRHLGPVAAALENKGYATQTGTYNALVEGRNRLVLAVKKAAQATGPSLQEEMTIHADGIHPENSCAADGILTPKSHRQNLSATEENIGVISLAEGLIKPKTSLAHELEAAGILAHLQAEISPELSRPAI